MNAQRITPGTWVAKCVGTTGDYDNPEDVYEVVADGYCRPAVSRPQGQAPGLHYRSVCKYATEADARLIAAAPELRAALETLYASVCGDSSAPPQLEAMKKAQAALSKSQGGSK